MCVSVGIWAGRPTIRDLNPQRIKPTRAHKVTEEQSGAGRALLPGHEPTTPWPGHSSSSRRQLRPPFSNPRARGERGGRGDFIQVALDLGNEGERGPPRAAMAAATGARGEFGSGREFGNKNRDVTNLSHLG